jgi:hypothetical protein
MWFLVVSTLLGALIGYVAADARGFSKRAGIIGGVLLGPLAFLMFFVSSVSRRRTCPHCAERIKLKAFVCKFCGRDVYAVQQRSA